MKKRGEIILQKRGMVLQKYVIILQWVIFLMFRRILIQRNL